MLLISTHYNQTNSWPTLSQAIDTNSRIFVFIEGGLNVRQLDKSLDESSSSFHIYIYIEQSTNTVDCSSLASSLLSTVIQQLNYFQLRDSCWVSVTIMCNKTAIPDLLIILMCAIRCGSNMDKLSMCY